MGGYNVLQRVSSSREGRKVLVGWGIVIIIYLFILILKELGRKQLISRFQGGKLHL